MQNPRLRKCVGTLCAFSLSCAAPAAELTWSGGSSGAGDAWRQANNWSPAAGQGGPGTGDLAVFSSSGTSSNIGIKFNDGLGVTTAVSAISLVAGPNRAVFNSSPNSSGTLRLEGWQGTLLANHSISSVLALRNGMDSSMRVELSTGGAIHVGSATAGIILESEVSGAHGLTKTGGGFLRLAHSNSLGGNVVVAGGTLELASATGSALGSAGTLRLLGGAVARLSSAEQLGAATALDLAGGTLRGAVAVTAVAETAGTLTLSADSVVDLGASNLRLADSSSIVWSPGATLTISNWRSVDQGHAGRLFFGPGGLTSTQLAQVYFADLGIRGAQLVGPDGELTPIPEAPITAAAVALAGLILWRERWRLLQAVRRRRPEKSGASAWKEDNCRNAG